MHQGELLQNQREFCVCGQNARTWQEFPCIFQYLGKPKPSCVRHPHGHSAVFMSSSRTSSGEMSAAVGRSEPISTAHATAQLFASSETTGAQWTETHMGSKIHSTAKLIAPVPRAVHLEARVIISPRVVLDATPVAIAIESGAHGAAESVVKPEDSTASSNATVIRQRRILVGHSVFIGCGAHVVLPVAPSGTDARDVIIADRASIGANVKCAAQYIGPGAVIGEGAVLVSLSDGRRTACGSLRFLHQVK